MFPIHFAFGLLETQLQLNLYLSYCVEDNNCWASTPETSHNSVDLSGTSAKPDPCMTITVEQHIFNSAENALRKMFA